MTGATSNILGMQSGCRATREIKGGSLNSLTARLEHLDYGDIAK
jgi:hypothetical protein